MTQSTSTGNPVGERIRLPQQAGANGFVPARGFGGRHRQTILATYLYDRGRFARQLFAQTVQHVVDVSHGDQIVLHDDRPHDWTGGDQAVLLVHGLAGCHGSPYMRRIAAKLAQRGVRVFRIDLRGGGAGSFLARRSYHAGLTGDITAALALIRQECPDSPLGLVGFSLGGNLILKLLGDAGHRPPENVTRAIAVCPPIDLEACSQMLELPMGRIYQRHFVQLIWHRLHERRRVLPDIHWGRLTHRRPRTLREFDDLYTAPLAGFRDVADYYAQCSAAGQLARITVPTHILAAQDDPVVDFRTFPSLPPSTHIQLHTPPQGGHLGFLARRSTVNASPDPDWHWMDWRVVEWLLP